MSIEPGIVAQLKSVGITGLMYVELERRGRDDPDLSPRVDFPSKYPVIPTKPSGIKQFMASVTDALQQVKDLDTKGLSEKIKTTLTNFDQTMDEAQIKQLAAGLDRVLQGLDTFLSEDELRRLIVSLEGTAGAMRSLSDRAYNAVSSAEETFNRLNQILNANASGFQAAVEGLNTTLSNADELFSSSAQMVEEAGYRMGQLQSQVTRLMISLEKTSEQLSLLMEQIAAQPSQLLLSSPPPER
jgi:phospholipid/cholesterol/gamma-HCH transport system substrate-binding protein